MTNCKVCQQTPAKTASGCCSKSCAMKLQHLEGKRKNVDTANKKTLYERLAEKYEGEQLELAKEAYRKKQENTRQTTDLTKQKESASLHFKKMNESRRGKKAEEFLGQEKAANFKQKLSLKYSGAGNPMFGKTSKGGRSVKGTYKGLFFRSLLEYSFMKHLESLGLDLHSQVSYEKIRIKVDENHTYCPDFFVMTTGTIYEVKPSRLSKIDINIIKFEAARKFCIEQNLSFCVITENDIQKIKFDDAKLDKDVKFDERTFKYFRNSNDQCV